MIVQPQLYAPNFRNVPRQPEWNENDSLECALVEHGVIFRNDKYASLRAVKFSVNKPLILGKLRCHEVFGCCSLHPEEFWTEFKIIEASDDSSNTNSKILSTWKIQQQLDGTDILLPRPILIRPKFVYQIYIECTKEFDYAFRLSSKEVQLKPHIRVKFHKNSYNQPTLLSNMYFNEIK